MGQALLDLTFTDNSALAPSVDYTRIGEPAAPISLLQGTYEGLIAALCKLEPPVQPAAALADFSRDCCTTEAATALGKRTSWCTTVSLAVSPHPHACWPAAGSSMGTELYQQSPFIGMMLAEYQNAPGEASRSLQQVSAAPVDVPVPDGNPFAVTQPATETPVPYYHDVPAQAAAQISPGPGNMQASALQHPSVQAGQPGRSAERRGPAGAAGGVGSSSPHEAASAPEGPLRPDLHDDMDLTATLSKDGGAVVLQNPDGSTALVLLTSDAARRTQEQHAALKQQYGDCVDLSTYEVQLSMTIHS